MDVLVAAIAAGIAFLAGFLATNAPPNSRAGDYPTGLSSIAEVTFPWVAGAVCGAAIYIGVRWLQRRSPLATAKSFPTVDLSAVPAPEPSVVVPAESVASTMQQ